MHAWKHGAHLVHPGCLYILTNSVLGPGIGVLPKIVREKCGHETFITRERHKTREVKSYRKTIVHKFCHL